MSRESIHRECWFLVRVSGLREVEAMSVLSLLLPLGNGNPPESLWSEQVHPCRKNE